MEKALPMHHPLLQELAYARNSMAFRLSLFPPFLSFLAFGSSALVSLVVLPLVVDPPNHHHEASIEGSRLEPAWSPNVAAWRTSCGTGECRAD